MVTPPTLAPGSVALNPYITGDTLNQALIAAGYGAAQAAQMEANDLATPGYGSQPGQYQSITNPASDASLTGYGQNVGGQLYNVQATITPAPNQNVLATPPHVVQSPIPQPTGTSHGIVTAPMYGTPNPWGGLTGPAPARSISATPNAQPVAAAPVVVPVSNPHAIAQFQAFVNPAPAPVNNQAAIARNLRNV